MSTGEKVVLLTLRLLMVIGVILFFLFATPPELLLMAGLVAGVVLGFPLGMVHQMDKASAAKKAQEKHPPEDNSPGREHAS